MSQFDVVYKKQSAKNLAALFLIVFAIVIILISLFPPQQAGGLNQATIRVSAAICGIIFAIGGTLLHMKRES